MIILTIFNRFWQFLTILTIMTKTIVVTWLLRVTLWQHLQFLRCLCILAIDWSHSDRTLMLQNSVLSQRTSGPAKKLLRICAHASLPFYQLSAQQILQLCFLSWLLDLDVYRTKLGLRIQHIVVYWPTSTYVMTQSDSSPECLFTGIAR